MHFFTIVEVLRRLRQELSRDAIRIEGAPSHAVRLLTSRLVAKAHRLSTLYDGIGEHPSSQRHQQESVIPVIFGTTCCRGILELNLRTVDLQSLDFYH